MDLKEEILSILREFGSLKAREITHKVNQKHNLEIEKKEVNRILYYKLKGLVVQDSGYRWSIGTTQEAVPEVIREVRETPLSKLCSYYLECLSKDMDSGIWCYASNRFGSPDYGQLRKLPQFAEEGEDIYDNQDAKRTIARVLGDRNRLVLQLGYLLNVRKVVARSVFYVVEPLLLIPFDAQNSGGNQIPSLSNELPQFNYEAISKITGLDKNELFEEVFSLSEELGMNNSLDEQPEFEDLIARLRNLRPHWNWIGNTDPEQLDETQIKTEPAPGIYNAAALFFSERSKYTKGLEKDLSDFKSMNENNYRESSLGKWISRNIPQYEFEEKIVIEPIPLNEEQRNAVKKALQAPLTVVTGPPGTGKSQVVTSIIVNAVYKGQKVLFASKNNKAVDVVNERVNGLTSRPVMLRLGNNQLQSELAQYLTGLLSASTSLSDQERHNVAQRRHEMLLQNLESIRKNQEEIISIRNDTDTKEQDIESHRSLFGEALFQEIRKWKKSKLEEMKMAIDSAEKAISVADRNKQSGKLKFLWPFVKKSRSASASIGVNGVRPFAEELLLMVPDVQVDEQSLAEYYRFIELLKERFKYACEVYDYFLNLELLKNKKTLFELARDVKRVEEDIAENSLELWESWLNLIPGKLTTNDRRVLGDFATLVNLIVAANANANQTRIERSVFARYYRLLPEIANILSCWAVTSLSVRGKVPSVSGFFDLVIIDEASQCDIASALPLLFRAKRAVIIGDSKQLTHISKINERQDMQLLEKFNLQDEYISWSYAGNSLFGLAQSICSSDDIVVLKDHHRSHADIINFSNREFYDGTLRVATRYEILKPLQNEPTLRWINVEGAVVSPNSGGSLNEQEAEAVLNELRRIVNTGYNGTIGVVTPFNAHATRIRDLVHSDNHLSDMLITRDFVADTVHKFQGDERDIMIFSPVISNGIGRGSIFFLSRTGNLFNVAITRARAALIVVGNKSQCGNCGVSYMERFVEYISNIRSTAQEHGNINADLGGTYPAMPSGTLVSDWERKLYSALYDSGIRTIPQYRVEQYSLDLALFKNGRMLDIEVDGEMYHRSWDGELCRRDQLRNRRLIELGWDVQRFWVYQVRDDLSYCISKVQNWLNDIE